MAKEEAKVVIADFIVNAAKDATPHFFRHIPISMLTDACVDLTTIMDLVGHDDMQTTLKVYTHLTNKMKKMLPKKYQLLSEAS